MREMPKPSTRAVANATQVLQLSDETGKPIKKLPPCCNHLPATVTPTHILYEPCVRPSEVRLRKARHMSASHSRDEADCVIITDDTNESTKPAEKPMQQTINKVGGSVENKAEGSQKQDDDEGASEAGDLSDQSNEEVHTTDASDETGPREERITPRSVNSRRRRSRSWDSSSTRPPRESPDVDERAVVSMPPRLPLRVRQKLGVVGKLGRISGTTRRRFKTRQHQQLQQQQRSLPSTTTMLQMRTRRAVLPFEASDRLLVSSYRSIGTNTPPIMPLLHWTAVAPGEANRRTVLGNSRQPARRIVIRFSNFVAYGILALALCTLLQWGFLLYCCHSENDSGVGGGNGAPFRGGSSGGGGGFHDGLPTAYRLY